MRYVSRFLLISFALLALTSCGAAYRFVGLEYELASEAIEDVEELEIKDAKDHKNGK